MHKTTRFWIVLVLALVAGAGGMAPPPALAATGPRIGAQVRVGDDPDPLRGHDVPALAVDPADANHIVEVDEDFVKSRCTFQTSFDGGKTWKGGELVPPADFPKPACGRFEGGDYAHVDGSVAWGTGQNVYTTFSWNKPGETDATLVARSTDGGRSFQPATVAIPGLASTDPANEGYDRPKLAVQARASGDRVAVASWLITLTGAQEPQQRRSVVAVSEDGATTWKPAVVASLPEEKTRELSQPVIGRDGAVYVAWRTLDPAPAQNFLVVGKSTDGGATWARTQAGPATGVRGSDPKLGIDPGSGNLYLAYWNTTAGDSDVFVRRSTDAGATWSPEIRVNDDKKGTTPVVQRLPQISVSGNGRVDVVWHDRRNAYRYPTTATSAPPGEQTGARTEDYYYAYSTDGGATFSANRRVNERTIGLDTGLDRRVTGGFYWAALAPAGDDRLLVAWGSSDYGNAGTDTNDVVMASVDLQRTGPLLGATGASNAVNAAVGLSLLAYPGGGEGISIPADNNRVVVGPGTKVVIANEDDAAAAVAGSVLARANNGPLLLTPASGLPKAVVDEVKRLDPTGAYLVGDLGQLSEKVAGGLRSAGVPDTSIVRINGATGPELARQVAQTLDVRTDADKASGARPAFDSAVVVNPVSSEAGAATGFAAAQRLPILFVTADAVPPATADALKSLGIAKTIVVGDSSVVGDGVLGQLPGATRMAGDSPEATSEALAKEAAARGMAANVVYTTDGDLPPVAAALGAAVARLGGIELLTSGTDAASTQSGLQGAGLDGVADRALAVRTEKASGVNVPLVIVEVLVIAAGIGLLAAVALRRRRGATAA
jgi:hypothetical protein